MKEISVGRKEIKKSEFETLSKPSKDDSLSRQIN